MPLVSVLICAYNVEKYFAQALDAVVRQTWRNLEIFISSCLTVCHMVCGHRDLVFGNDGGAICISVTERR